MLPSQCLDSRHQGVFDDNRRQAPMRRLAQHAGEHLAAGIHHARKHLGAPDVDTHGELRHTATVHHPIGLILPIRSKRLVVER